jgi:hypothetical protein
MSNQCGGSLALVEIAANREVSGLADTGGPRIGEDSEDPAA